MKTNALKLTILACGAILASGLLSQAKAGSAPNPSGGDALITLGNMPIYIEMFGGPTTYPDLDYNATSYKMDDGYNIGGAIGTSLNDYFDVEFEVAYTETSYTGFDDTFTSLSLMTNANFNFPIVGALSGYVGGGIGGMQIGYDFAGGTASQDWVLGYQFMAGLRYPVCNRASVFAEYRYCGTEDDAQLYATDRAEYKSNNFSLGLRCTF